MANASQNKFKILLVDDSQSMREIVHNFLKKNYSDRADFLQAEDGSEAELLLQEMAIADINIDLIILDWMMPHLSGREFLERLRSIPRYYKLPAVIMLTAETYPEQIESALIHNVSSYVTKPFSEEDICRAVDKALQSVIDGGLKNAV